MEIIKVIVDKLPVSCSKCEWWKTRPMVGHICGLNDEWIFCNPFEERGRLCPLEVEEN